MQRELLNRDFRTAPKGSRHTRRPTAGRGEELYALPNVPREGVVPGTIGKWCQAGSEERRTPNDTGVRGGGSTQIPTAPMQAVPDSSAATGTPLAFRAISAGLGVVTHGDPATRHGERTVDGAAPLKPRHQRRRLFGDRPAKYDLELHAAEHRDAGVRLLLEVDRSARGDSDRIERRTGVAGEYLQHLCPTTGDSHEDQLARCRRLARRAVAHGAIHRQPVVADGGSDPAKDRGGFRMRFVDAWRAQGYRWFR